MSLGDKRRDMSSDFSLVISTRQELISHKIMFSMVDWEDETEKFKS